MNIIVLLNKIIYFLPFILYNYFHKIKGDIIMQNTHLSSDYDTTISLLNVYLAEWIHRDQIIWSQTFKFFYAILIIILLPNLALHFDLALPNLPIFIFRIIGLFLSLLFLYISLGYAIRLQAISDTYRDIIKTLPQEYQRKSIKDIKFKNRFVGKLFMPRIGYVICLALFLVLFSLSIILMII